MLFWIVIFDMHVHSWSCYPGNSLIDNISTPLAQLRKTLFLFIASSCKINANSQTQKSNTFLHLLVCLFSSSFVVSSTLQYVLLWKALCCKPFPNWFQFWYFSWQSIHSQACVTVSGDFGGHFTTTYPYVEHPLTACAVGWDLHLPVMLQHYTQSQKELPILPSHHRRTVGQQNVLSLGVAHTMAKQLSNTLNNVSWRSALTSWTPSILPFWQDAEANTGLSGDHHGAGLTS